MGRIVREGASRNTRRDEPNTRESPSPCATRPALRITIEGANEAMARAMEIQANLEGDHTTSKAKQASRSRFGETVKCRPYNCNFRESGPGSDKKFGEMLLRKIAKENSRTRKRNSCTKAFIW